MSAILSSCCRSLAATSVARSATAASSILRSTTLSFPTQAQSPSHAAWTLSATSAALRLQHQHHANQVRSYQVRASIKPRCEHCYMVMRKGRRYILCKKVARHKQRQG
ncbi:hypothetical protein BCR44DRAFT_1430699 [Catenaria anguillulae PL171]|uniref:Ribosomal protein n=1 Tax=Catenaria anguillulae PL171 TaxID=765915 RepID=A0A1Y2HRJ5_9FUNG|nr:hypothetical protein BCR44DRAFT_1430699 [Catenaria anguillulae PL171]